ncbi:MAG: hypothetical protein MJ193_03645, partial [Clostridia bacterium]|nr:hypothetical protein [Clostridia bacterium]
GLSVYFSNGNLLSAVFATAEDDRSFYAVVSGGSDDALMTKQSAELISLRGGAGYIMSAENVIVLAVYKSESDAKSVISKIGDNSLSVQKIDIDNIKLSGLSTDEKECAKTALDYFDTAFDALYDMSDLLAKGKLTATDISTQKAVLYARIDDIKSVFYSKTASSTYEKITEIKLALVTALAIIDNISVDGDTATLSSIRYALCQLVFCYQALSNRL